jgi:hypothetical protein
MRSNFSGSTNFVIIYRMAHTITIQLSDTLFSPLQRAAELAHQPVDKVVEQGLNHVLPPLLEEIPPIYQADVYPLLAASDTELYVEALRRFPAEQWEEYEQLLDRKKETTLSIQEQARLNVLRREADILMFRKSYAAVLLKRRGYQPPSLQQLRQVV